MRNIYSTTYVVQLDKGREITIIHTPILKFAFCISEVTVPVVPASMLVDTIGATGIRATGEVGTVAASVVATAP